MNESETRPELIALMPRNCGCGIMQDSGVARAFGITAGSIQAGGATGLELTAMYSCTTASIGYGIQKQVFAEPMELKKSILQMAFRRRLTIDNIHPST